VLQHTHVLMSLVASAWLCALLGPLRQLSSLFDALTPATVCLMFLLDAVCNFVKCWEQQDPGCADSTVCDTPQLQSLRM
jgi:hypothetical protein